MLYIVEQSIGNLFTQVVEVFLAFGANIPLNFIFEGENLRPFIDKCSPEMRALITKPKTYPLFFVYFTFFFFFFFLFDTPKSCLT
jgi:hypothetical protein